MVGFAKAGEQTAYAIKQTAADAPKEVRNLIIRDNVLDFRQIKVADAPKKSPIPERPPVKSSRAGSLSPSAAREAMGNTKHIKSATDNTKNFFKRISIPLKKVVSKKLLNKKP